MPECEQRGIRQVVKSDCISFEFDNWLGNHIILRSLFGITFQKVFALKIFFFFFRDRPHAFLESVHAMTALEMLTSYYFIINQVWRSFSKLNRCTLLKPT